MRFLMIAAALVCATAPVLAQADDTPTPTATPTPKPEKKECRSQEVYAGSRIGASRICHTKAEWADIDAGSDRTARDLDRKRP